MGMGAAIKVFSGLWLTLLGFWILIVAPAGFRFTPEPQFKAEREEFRRDIRGVSKGVSVTLAKIDLAQLKEATQEAREIWDSDRKKTQAELEELRSSPFFGRMLAKNGGLENRRSAFKAYSTSVELTKVSYGDPKKECQALLEELDELDSLTESKEEASYEYAAGMGFLLVFLGLLFSLGILSML
jgi:hypothetical protein